jgi:dynactin complex subunit
MAVYVCKHAECRERHKTKCSYELRAEVSRLREADKEQLKTISALGLNLRSVMARAEGYQLMKARLEEAEAEVSRLQQENALLRRSLEMLTKQMAE